MASSSFFQKAALGLAVFLLTGICMAGTVAASEIRISFGEHAFAADLVDNAATRKLVERLESGAIEVQMREFGGFEKTGPLGFSLPRVEMRMTAKPGDVLLYNGNTILVFFGENAWSYTPIGKVRDVEGLLKALPEGRLVMTFSLERQD